MKSQLNFYKVVKDHGQFPYICLRFVVVGFVDVYLISHCSVIQSYVNVSLFLRN